MCPEFWVHIKITILSHSQSFEGAQSSAIIKTLFGIGKRNGLDSKKYINHLLTYLPNEDTLEENEILQAYLPWNKNIQY